MSAYRIVLKLLRTFGLNWWVTALLPVKCPKQLIVVTGCYNSGTTLLQRIMQLHPELTGIPPYVEGDVLVKELPKAEDFSWRRMWHRCAKDIQKLGNQPRLAKAALKQWRWWIDKDKGFVEKSVCDILRIDFYRRSFKSKKINVKFVIIVRHPLAVIEGLLRRAKPMPAVAGQFEGGVYPAEMAVEQWKASSRLTCEQMEYDDVFTLRYEDLCSHPEVVIPGLCDFLGVDSRAYRFEEGTVEAGGGFLKLRNNNARSQNNFSSSRWADILANDSRLEALMSQFLYSSDATN